MRTSFALLAFLFLAAATPAGALAQTAATQTAAADTAGGAGTAYLVGWPDESGDGDWYDRLRREDLLAFIDTLSLDYAWRVEDGAPSVRVGVSWQPGAGGILDGQRVARALLPADVRLVALALDADVVVAGVRVGGLAVELDSVALSPAPDRYDFETGPLDWGTLFTGASAATAREAFETGFSLENLRVRSIAFASDAGEEAERRPHTVVHDPRAPRRVGVYTHEPSVFVDVRLGWLLGRPARPPQRATAPRGERIGRGTLTDGRTTRTRGGRSTDRATRDGAAAAADATPDETAEAERPGGRSAGLLEGLRRARGKDAEKDEDEDEDDDSNQLLPAGLVAAAAVGVLAYHSGTIGYLGQTRYAPLGVATGYVTARGGTLVQAGVSESVLRSGDGPRHATLGVYGFRAVPGFPLQPALGIGLLATDEGSTVGLAPSLAVGAAFNRGPVVGLATYDVLNGGLALGAAINFRARRR